VLFQQRLEKLFPASKIRLSEPESAPEGKDAKAKAATKTKFSCPECNQNAWTKPDALLICGVCYEDGEGDISLMLAEQPDRPAPKQRHTGSRKEPAP
jgi:hypothetical protein